MISIIVMDKKMGTLLKGESLPKNVILVGDVLNFLMTHNKRRYKRSLQIELTGSKADRKEALLLATKKSLEYRQLVRSGEWEQRLKEDAGKDSVQDLLDAFETYATGTEKLRRTISDYKATARKMAAVLHPGRSLSNLPLSTLFHADTLRDWEAHKIRNAREKANANGFQSEDILYKARNAAAADTRQLKALWSRHAMESKPYRILTYDPIEIAAFKAHRVKAPKPHAFQPPSTETRQKFLRLMEIAERYRPRYWLAAVLTGTIGLRRGDAIAARWEYIVDTEEDCLDPHDGTLKPARVIYYAFSGSSDKGTKRQEIKARIPLHVYLRMLKARQGNGPYIVPGGSQKHRLAIYKRWARILKSIGVTDPRPNHYLRKWVGALYATQFGILDAAVQLGNSDLRTVKDRYSAILNPTRTASLI